MKKQLRDKWVAALRSGKYAQTRNNLLFTEDLKESFCAFGVLWDLLGRKFSDKGPLLNIMCDEAQIEKAAVDTIIHMNDRDCASFGEIADWIEKNL